MSTPKLSERRNVKLSPLPTGFKIVNSAEDADYIKLQPIIDAKTKIDGLSMIDIRSDNYKNRCETYVMGGLRGSYSVVDKEIAIDHIIELWQIKDAYVRLQTTYSQRKPVQDKDNYFNLSKEALQKAQEDPVNFMQAPAFADKPNNKFWSPVTFRDHLVTLSKISEVVNSKDNLCGIDPKWNGSKYHAVAGHNFTGPKDFRKQLMEYYVTMVDKTARMVNSLTFLSLKTGNGYYADLASYLIKQQKAWFDSKDEGNMDIMAVKVGGQ